MSYGSTAHHGSVSMSTTARREGKFEERFDFATRQRESRKIREKFPDRVPIVVEHSTSCKTLAAIDKTKFLVPADITVAQLVFVVRKRLEIASTDAIFLFVMMEDGKPLLPPSGITVQTLYSDHAHSDGFLYCEYSGENVFG